MDYIDQNFSWDLENQKQILWLAEYKMKIMDFFNKDETVTSQTENYVRYKLLKYWDISEYNITKYSQNDVFIPLNNWVKKMKLELFKFFSTKNLEYMQTYIISLYNDLLDLGKNINISELENMLNNTNINNMQKKLNSIYNQIMN
jgi:hypothetical protein